MDFTLVEKTKTKKQHFVPQFYLKNFCNAQNKLCVYDKKDKKYFYSTSKDICYKNYLYEYDADDSLMSNGKHILPNDIENIYAKEEGNYSAFLKVLLKRLNAQINPNAIILNSSEISVLYDFINNLMIRHPNMMDRFLTDKDYSHFCNVIEESGTANVLKEIFDGMKLGSPEGFKRSVFKKIYLDSKGSNGKGVTFVPYLNEMSFVFLKSETEGFITSDYPIRMAIYEDDDCFDSLYFPLSPKYAINFFNCKTADRNRIRVIDSEMTNKLNVWMLVDEENRLIISNDRTSINQTFVYKKKSLSI